MKTYTKLPIEQVSSTVNGVTTQVAWPQMYAITETVTNVTTDKTTRENFVNIIASLNTKKTEFNTQIDAEIAEAQAILVEIDKL